MRRPFRQVDVFTDTAYLGNPVAVVLDADGLSSEQMQRVARWTNLSETTFVLPPTPAGTRAGADYRVRIFTPEAELPFAGHPTLGTCQAWSEVTGMVRAEVLQECAAGLVRVRRETGPEGDRLAFAAPPLVRSGPVDAGLLTQVAAILGVDDGDVVAAEWVDNGPGWLAVLLPDAAAVLALDPGPLEGLFIGAVGPHPPGSPEAIEVRAFFGVHGQTVEDPVTGSLNASLAEWLVRTGRVRLPYVAAQGTALGRRGRVHVTGDEHGGLWVGGQAVVRVAGQIEL